MYQKSFELSIIIIIINRDVMSIYALQEQPIIIITQCHRISIPLDR